MTLQTILDRIYFLVDRFVHPGWGSTQPYYSFIRSLSIFITRHKLILFFVLLSFLFFAIRLIRRMIS